MLGGFPPNGGLPLDGQEEEEEEEDIEADGTGRDNAEPLVEIISNGGGTSPTRENEDEVPISPPPRPFPRYTYPHKQTPSYASGAPPLPLKTPPAVRQRLPPTKNKQRNASLQTENEVTDEEFVARANPAIRWCNKAYLLMAICTFSTTFLGFLIFIVVTSKRGVATEDALAARIMCKPELSFRFTSRENANSNNAWTRQLLALEAEYKRTLPSKNPPALIEEELGRITQKNEVPKEDIATNRKIVLAEWKMHWSTTGIACDQHSPNYRPGLISSSPLCTNISELYDNLYQHALENGLAASAFLSRDFYGPIPKVCICMPPPDERTLQSANSTPQARDPLAQPGRGFLFFEITKQAEKSALFTDETHYYQTTNSSRKLPEWITATYFTKKVGQFNLCEPTTQSFYEPDEINCLLRCNELMPTPLD